MLIDSHLKTRKIETTPWLIEGELDEKTLSRVAQAATDKRVRAEVKIALQREARNEIRITGHISAEIEMHCQRCLQLYKSEVDIDIDEIFTDKAQTEDMRFGDDEVNQDSEQSDYFDKEGDFRLLHYIEDEILLAIPTFPVHINAEECDNKMLTYLDEKAVYEEAHNNPFSVLKNLK